MSATPSLADLLTPPLPPPEVVAQLPAELRPLYAAGWPSQEELAGVREQLQALPLALRQALCAPLVTWAEELATSDAAALMVGRALLGRAA